MGWRGVGGWRRVGSAGVTRFVRADTTPFRPSVAEGSDGTDVGAIWNGIKAALGYSLSFFYSIVPDYGMAIILLTVAVSLLLFP